MTSTTQSPTSVTSIAVTMFAVADVDAAIAFYTGKLGYELRADVAFGPEGENRWVEVAPAGSAGRLALNPPMGGEAGGSAIGVETPDVRGEHERLRALGVDVDPQLMEVPNAPLMFGLRDPDGNQVWVTEAPPA